MRKIRAFVVIAMAALLALSATVPAGAEYAYDFIVIRLEAPYYIYQIDASLHWRGQDSWWLPMISTTCQEIRVEGDYDELWFDRNRGCKDVEKVHVEVTIWRSRTKYDTYTLYDVPWNTKLTLTGNGWERSMR